MIELVIVKDHGTDWAIAISTRSPRAASASFLAAGGALAGIVHNVDWLIQGFTRDGDSLDFRGLGRIGPHRTFPLADINGICLAKVPRDESHPDELVPAVRLEAWVSVWTLTSTFPRTSGCLSHDSCCASASNASRRGPLPLR